MNVLRPAALAALVVPFALAPALADPPPAAPAKPAPAGVSLKFRELDGTLKRWVYHASFSPSGDLVADRRAPGTRDEDAQPLVYLGCRQPDALVLLHRLEHVVDELS